MAIRRPAEAKKTKPNEANIEWIEGFLLMAQEIATALRASQ